MRYCSQIFCTMCLFLEGIRLRRYQLQRFFRRCKLVRLQKSLLTSASAVPIMSTSSACSSYLCSFPFGASHQTPFIDTTVPVPNLSCNASVNRNLRGYAIESVPFCMIGWQQCLQCMHRRSISYLDEGPQLLIPNSPDGAHRCNSGSIVSRWSSEKGGYTWRTEGTIKTLPYSPRPYRFCTADNGRDARREAEKLPWHGVTAVKSIVMQPLTLQTPYSRCVEACRFEIVGRLPHPDVVAQFKQ